MSTTTTEKITAYVQFLGFIHSLDTMAAQKRIAGKFISNKDAQGISDISFNLWGLYKIRRDNLHDAGVDWKNACEYASSYALNLFAMGAYNS